MQAAISVLQQLTRETVEIIVCRSLLAALTSGESLCGALTELFEVSVTMLGSGMVQVCTTCYFASVVHSTIHTVSNWWVGRREVGGKDRPRIITGGLIPADGQATATELTFFSLNMDY